LAAVEVDMSSIKIRTKRIDGKLQIRTLISHPMETGRSRNKQTNELIPAHFIRLLTLSHNDKVVVSADLSTSISKDPYFAFMLKNSNAGDKITVSWEDNLGQQDSETHVVK
jgi:sulfur-oxidizing protein SoxZ